jgi:prepilin-type N-terminal cleavage/methylation domain-containing protein
MLRPDPYCLPKKNNNHGFTLLELIIVLFLMSLILSLSLLMFANALPSNRFNATVRNISTTIKHARSLAEIHGERKIVTINLDEKKYGLEGYGMKELPSDTSVKVLDPLSGELTEGKYSLLLFPAGRFEGGTIIIWNEKKEVSIAIDPIVGTIAIETDEE